MALQGDVVEKALLSGRWGWSEDAVDVSASQSQAGWRGSLRILTLCGEAVRTERGPRHRIVATLGKLDPEARQAQRDWSDIDALLEGGNPPAASRPVGAGGAGAAALAAR